ncbi:MAG TPA: hypothetical protein VKW76_13110 [Candidatus Binatia bacterium]|nr:hypothetical protein [Candidatus Binatia bacterium]
MRSGRARIAALAATVALTSAAACGLASHDPTSDPLATRVGAADRIGDGFEGAALADLLGPEERAAAERAGIPVDAPSGDDATAEPSAGDTGNAAAAAGIGFLEVGLSIAAMAAPFFAF